jgi:hypothetical protein
VRADQLQIDGVDFLTAAVMPLVEHQGAVQVEAYAVLGLHIEAINAALEVDSARPAR